MQVPKSDVQYVTYAWGNKTDDTAMMSTRATVPPKMIHPVALLA